MFKLDEHYYVRIAVSRYGTWQPKYLVGWPCWMTLVSLPLFLDCLTSCITLRQESVWVRVPHCILENGLQNLNWPGNQYSIIICVKFIFNTTYQSNHESVTSQGLDKWRIFMAVKYFASMINIFITYRTGHISWFPKLGRLTGKNPNFGMSISMHKTFFNKKLCKRLSAFLKAKSVGQ